MNKPTNERVEYFLKRPNENGRVTFSITKRTKRPNQKPLHEATNVEALVKINNAFKSKIIDYSTANFQVEQICKSLNDNVRKIHQSFYSISDSNQKLLEQYWTAVYKRRKIKSPESARHRLEWGLKYIGTFPLLGDIDELQKLVDERSFGDRRKQRRACSIINQLRGWFGSPEKLQLERKTLPDFHYLTEEEFNQVIQNVEIGSSSRVKLETYKSFYTVLFYSGVRTGEAFALRKDNYNGKNGLKVLTQLTRSEKETDTKNSEIRTAYYFSEKSKELSSWVSAKDKYLISRNDLARLFRRACKKTFPNDTEKWTTAHDLRHSYAIMMLTKYDISISQIAKILGNSVQVCEDYYLRYIRNDDLIDSISRKITLARSA